MIDARSSDLRIAFGLGQDERALQHRLGVKRQASRRPITANAVTVHGFGDIRLDLGRVAADAGIARIANLGAGLIDFLHHSSDKAGEFGNRAGEDRLAEIDVAENPLERISMAVVRRGRGNAERFLGLEVMKEGPLGNTSFGAQLVDGRGRIALGADHRQGRVEKLLPGGGHGTLGQRFIAHGRIILTSRYNSKLRFACRRWAETHDSRISPKPLPSLANPPRSAPACRRTFDSRARSVRSLEHSLIEDGAISWRCYESRSGSAVTPAMGL